METLNKKEILKFLNSDNPRELFAEADNIRKKYCGDSVHLRGIIEFSNCCKKDCLYCGLRAGNKKIERYRMSFDEIIDTAKKAAEFDYKSLVLQSGEDDTYTAEELCDIVKRIKSEVDCAVTLSLGERTFDEYRMLKEAGADRYLLKFETSNKRLFKRLKPDSSYDNRINCLKQLKELAFQTGSGFMVGLPGQTAEMLAEDILFIAGLGLDMIGIGPFIPHHDTPLNDTVGGTVDMTLKAVALVRILTKKPHMPATTALGSIHPEGRQLALRCGANVVMPNLTPTSYRRLYSIYPNKICIDEKPGDCRNCVEAMLKALGRTVDTGYGHSIV